MLAAELLYFTPAPVAQIVAYEEHHRLKRIARNIPALVCRRLRRFRS